MKHLREPLFPLSKGGTANVTKTFQQRLKFLAPLVLLLAVWCILSPAKAFAADASNPNPRVLPPNSMPYGHSYIGWSNLWWQWALSIPQNINPVLDTTGATNCSVNQSGSVWFLAGILGGSSESITRNCTVPAGKALFFPIANDAFVWINGDCSIDTTTPVATGQQMITDFLDAQNPQGFVSQVDEQSLQNLGAYIVGPNNPRFTVTDPLLLSDLLGGCSVSGMSYPAVNGGYYLMLAPLSAGAHTITFKAPSNSQDITYHLIVGG